jgi:xanthine/uracil permease
MPADPWIAIITMVAVILMAVGLRGFAGRIAVFLGLVFGYVLSWLADLVFGDIHSTLPGAAAATTHARVSWAGVKAADWFGFPPHTPDSLTGNQGFTDQSHLLGWHAPSFSLTFILLAIPAVIALVAENTGHVKAVAEMTERDLDPYLGRAIAADGIGTALASAVGGSPTTTYAENIGVMAATRVYSTAAYFVAAIVAIVLGFVPKFGQLVDATPGGALGGVTLVLYGMIGLLGAKIWKENNVDFAKPVNLVPIAAGIILGIVAGSSLKIAHNFTLSGIALGTVVAVGGYHLARLVSRDEDDEGAMIVAGGPGAQTTDPPSTTSVDREPGHRAEPDQE